MRIQILQVSASRKFLVQSYGPSKFWSMVMKFEILMENDKFSEIKKLKNLA